MGCYTNHKITAVTFSVDRKLVAFALQHKMIKVLDVASGALRQSFGSHDSYVTDLAFSLDSRMLTSAAEDNIVRLWDIATRTVLQSGSVAVKEMKLSFSMDGKYLRIDQLLLRIESPSPEAFEIGFKLPPSYYLSSPNLRSNVLGEVILFSPLNGGTMEIPGIVVAKEEDVPVPIPIMDGWNDRVSWRLRDALESTDSYRQGERVAYSLHMAAKTRAQSRFLKLRPTILIHCLKPSSKKVIEKDVSRQMFLDNFQVIVYVHK